MHLVTSFLVLKPTLPLHILMLVYSLIIYSKWSPAWCGVCTRWRPSLPKEYPFPVSVSTSAQGWLNPLSVIQCFAIDFKGMERGCGLDICKQQRLNEGAHGLCRFRTGSTVLRTVKKIFKYIAKRRLIHTNVYNHFFCKGPQVASEEP